MLGKLVGNGGKKIYGEDAADFGVLCGDQYVSAFGIGGRAMVSLNL